MQPITITATAYPTTAERPDNWGSDARGWDVTLTNTEDGGTITVPFWQGSRCTEPPTARDVLECLFSDASHADEDFEEWADSLGYDTDSRRAFATWEAVRQQTAMVFAWLGSDADGYLYTDPEDDWRDETEDGTDAVTIGDEVRSYDETADEFRAEILPLVVEQYGPNDGPAIAEAWNNWTDDLCKSGAISAWQYDRWGHPED